MIIVDFFFLPQQYQLPFFNPVENFPWPLGHRKFNGMADADSLEFSLSILSTVQRQLRFWAPASLWNCLFWGKSCQVQGTFEGLNLSLAFNTTGYTVLSKKHSLSMSDGTFSDPSNLSRVSAASFSTGPSSHPVNDSVLLGSFLNPPLYMSRKSKSGFNCHP